jgi:membrane protease YdiL (CAAX protease family)
MILGRSVAARGGGWARTLGLDLVRRGDWLPWLLGLGLMYTGRTVVVVLVNVSIDGRAVAEAGNLKVFRPGWMTVIALALVLMVLAPVTEELLFRGFLLRAFMQRMPFWPAAGLSTAAFTAIHLYQVDTIVGAVALAGSTSVLGLTTCYLVRITGRLTPGMMVHATANGVALLVAVLV